MHSFFNVVIPHFHCINICIIIRSRKQHSLFENGLSAIYALNVLLFELANRIISVFTTNVVSLIVSRAQRQTITNSNTTINVKPWVARMPHIVFNLGETCDPNPLSFEADVCACRPPKARYILSAGDRVQLHLEEVHLHL